MTTVAVPPVLKAAQAITDREQAIADRDQVIGDQVIGGQVIGDRKTAVGGIADRGKDAGCRTGVPMGALRKIAVRKSGVRAIAVRVIAVPVIGGREIVPRGWDQAGGCRRCASANGRRSNGISMNCASGSAS